MIVEKKDAKMYKGAEELQSLLIIDTGSKYLSINDLVPISTY